MAGEGEEYRAFSHLPPLPQPVRSTHSLEVPLAHNTSLLTPTEVGLSPPPFPLSHMTWLQYLRHVVNIGNAKLKENLQRIERYRHAPLNHLQYV